MTYDEHRALIPDRSHVKFNFPLLFNFPSQWLRPLSLKFRRKHEPVSLIRWLTLKICFSVHCTCHLGSHPSATEIILVLFPWCPCVPTPQTLHKPKTAGYYLLSKTYANRIWILTLPFLRCRHGRWAVSTLRESCFVTSGVMTVSPCCSNIKLFQKPLLWISWASTFFPRYLLLIHARICIPPCTHGWCGLDKETADRCVFCRECTFGSTDI